MNIYPVTPCNGAPYDVIIGAGLLTQSGDLIAQRIGQRKCIIIVDEAVAPLYAQAVSDSLNAAGHNILKTIKTPQGEGAKAFPVYHGVMEEALALRPDRDVLIVALGGGVCGDLAGFVAATLLRGVAFVQIPTSLLAQVDSAVGGKTGINAEIGKNLIGAFHHPRLVLSDVDTFQTLPERERLAGYAELVKHAVIADKELFNWLEQHAAQVIAGESEMLAQAIHRSCAVKARIVSEDALEKTGARALLNFGHTFGHALEARMGYDGRLLHGEGVSIGMVMALHLSHAMGLCDGQDQQRVIRHFETIGMMTHARGLGVGSAQDVYAAMHGDKKAQGGQLRFILSQGIGAAQLSDQPTKQQILQAMEQLL